MALSQARGGRRAAIAIACVFTSACGGGGGGGGNGGASTPQNRAPTLATTQFNVNEDAELSARVTGSDPDGDALTFTRTSDAANGSVSAFGADGSFTYRPRADFFGSDSFSVRLADAQGNAVTGAIAIQVANVDDPVAARPDAMRADGAALDSIDVLANDSNPDRKSLTVTIEEAASIGTVSVVANGSIRITGLPTGFRGVTRFAYRVTETNGAFSSAGAAIFVGIDPFRVAFVGDEASDGSPEIFLTDLAAPPRRITAATEGSLRARGFLASQNGATIVYRRNDGAAFHDLSFVRTTDPSMQHRIQLPSGTRYFPAPFSGADQYAVSGDGQWIAAVVATEPPANAAVVVLNVNDPTMLYTPTPPSATNAASLKFSHDSRYLYFRAQENTPWRLYRTALVTPNQSTPLSTAMTGDPAEGVTHFAVSADQARVVFNATHNGIEHIYFVDPSTPASETRLSHVLGRSNEILSSTVFNFGDTLGGSPDGSRIAYTVNEAGGLISYVADVSTTPNPRTVGVPGMTVNMFRPDNAALLYVETVTDPVRTWIDHVYEVLVDSTQPHTLVGEGFNAQYDVAGDAILMQHATYLDPSEIYVTVRAAQRPAFGVSQHVGTPGLAATITSLSGSRRGIAIIGEGPPPNGTPSARLALVNAWAPDRLLYLAPFPSPRNFAGRGIVVDAASTP